MDLNMSVCLRVLYEILFVIHFLRSVVCLIHKHRINPELQHTWLELNGVRSYTIPSHLTTPLVPGLHIPPSKLSNKTKTN